jgi:sensor c-di-GMP phosphodiesterase-like protein
LVQLFAVRKAVHSSNWVFAASYLYRSPTQEAGNLNRKTLIHIGLLLCGTLIGLLLAQSFGEIVRLRSGQAELNDYAIRLQQASKQIALQSQHAVNTVLRDNLPVCSPRELALMRSLVYTSSQIKDIGRIRDGKFVCSAGVGVLPTPVVQGRPDASFRSMMVFAWIPLAISKDSKGFIVQVRGVNVVLNPDAFEGLNDPNHTYAAFLYDQPTRILIHAFGQKIPLSNEEVLAGRLIERNGIYYRPLCSPKSWGCVVAAESRKSILARSATLHEILLLAGALLGDTVVLALALFYQKHRSQESQLRRALRRGQLSLLYQPIVDIHTRAIVGAEALIRWTNEQREPVNPEIFVALAEERGFVGEITRFVLRTALEELGPLLASSAFRLTLNISSHDLSDETFCTLVQDSLHRAGVSPFSLGLELTERSASTHKSAIDSIAQLRNAGHTVYIDDFGTGYSSLAYLRDLSVDVIKIDRAFTATIGTHAITESIIPQILQMAEQLRLAVVVEGIETEEQAAYFRATGNGILGQGWLDSRPVPAARLHDLLQSHAETSTLLEIPINS